jgi:M6 family metalloprotease-like protein
MMRKLFFTMSLLMIVAVAFAVPAKRGQWRNITLTDGSVVRAELCGDENLSYYRAADGRLFLSEGEKVYRMAQPAEVKSLRAKRSAERHQMRTAANTQQNKASYTGAKKGLVILTQFQDKSFQPGNDQALYNRILNENNFSHSIGFIGSVHDYFNDVSDGQFDLTFDVVGPVTVSHDMEYYGARNGKSSDVRAPVMVREACTLAKDLVNFADYDWDNDGKVDQVVIVYAGLGEANGGEANTIWPHEYYLSGYYGIYNLPNIDGKRIDKYACSSELQPQTWGYNSEGIVVPTSTMIDGIGTFCHEFGHCLGLPDFYDTEESDGRNFGMDAWDIMDQGSYNNRGFCPAGYSSYERMFAGWKTPITLTEDTEVTGMKALSEGGDSYIMYNDAHKDEYFLLENRQQTKWDTYLPGNGLLILHVDYDSDAWWQNVVNNDAEHQRCTIVHADNSATTSEAGLAGDPFPYRSNNSFTNTSKPAATLFNNNTDGTKLLNKSITEITRNSDKTISFNFTNSGTSPEDDLEEIDHTDAVFYESFDQCNGTGGNDGVWEGSGVAVATFKPDMQGWVYNEAKGADNCARFGVKKVGQCMTPKFTLNGSTTFAFRAAPWGTDATTMNVQVIGDGSLDVSDFTLKTGHWTVCKTTITGNGELQLKFTPGNRMFLDEVVIQKVETVDGIESVYALPETDGNNQMYNLSGQKVDSSYRGIVIINGKKVIVK